MNLTLSRSPIGIDLILYTFENELQRFELNYLLTYSIIFNETMIMGVCVVKYFSWSKCQNILSHKSRNPSIHLKGIPLQLWKLTAM